MSVNYKEGLKGSLSGFYVQINGFRFVMVCHCSGLSCFSNHTS